MCVCVFLLLYSHVHRCSVRSCCRRFSNRQRVFFLFFCFDKQRKKRHRDIVSRTKAYLHVSVLWCFEEKNLFFPCFFLSLSLALLFSFSRLLCIRSGESDLGVRFCFVLLVRSYSSLCVFVFVSFTTSKPMDVV